MGTGARITLAQRCTARRQKRRNLLETSAFFAANPFQNALKIRNNLIQWGLQRSAGTLKPENTPSRPHDSKKSTQRLCASPQTKSHKFLL
jgi:hypothetical protein